MQSKRNLKKRSPLPHWLGYGVSLLVSGAIGPALEGVLPQPAAAVQLADGTVYFEQPPRLIDYATTRSTTLTAGATYYFTLQLPANAGEPLQRVVIEQRESATSARRSLIRPEDSFAFLGTRRERGDRLPLGGVTYNRDTQTTEVVFEPAVAPGATVTIALRPRRTPQLDGLYLFRVEAFPPGELAHGQFLGFGRLSFDRPERFFRF